MRSIKIIFEALEINPKILFASEIGVEGKKTNF